jgi:hypothetical protein
MDNISAELEALYAAPAAKVGPTSPRQELLAAAEILRRQDGYLNGQFCLWLADTATIHGPDDASETATPGPATTSRPPRRPPSPSGSPLRRPAMAEQAYVNTLAAQLCEHHPDLIAAEKELAILRPRLATVARFINNPHIALDIRQNLARDLHLPEPNR